jgi:CRISPR-associated protein Cas1
LVVWTGEQAVRFYAQGLGETRSSARLLKQVECWANVETRMEVVRRLYQARFSTQLDPDLTLQQIRGMEGVRVRESYARASKTTGVVWTGRSYDRGTWAAADPINRALSAANSCLYGVCHAAILASGYLPALGFIHSGKTLSFVYDVADLHKTETSVPTAFAVVAEGHHDLESRVRRALREQFATTHLLARIVEDLARLFGDVPGSEALDADLPAPGQLWAPDGMEPGGVNWADGEDGGK